MVCTVRATASPAVSGAQAHGAGGFLRKPQRKAWAPLGKFGGFFATLGGNAPMS